MESRLTFLLVVASLFGAPAVSGLPLVTIFSKAIRYFASGDAAAAAPAVHNGPPAFCNDLSCPRFQIIDKTLDYELRRYEAVQWVSTNTSEGYSYTVSTTRLFRKLFKYIKGANAEEKKIAMTVPVINLINETASPRQLEMSFYLPAEKPQPSDPRVYLTNTPKMLVYVREFGGFTFGYRRWEMEAKKLTAALDSAGITYHSTFFYTASYNSPFTLFGRHNEIWVIAK
ncbi:heme-binding protein 2-like [Tubulanus polymorphus]|uniref:heme-binding protein 2-like n=1 Tax=Tubulanus polymorphus TaxID=672921 RepID=UPI003DA4D1E5